MSPSPIRRSWLGKTLTGQVLGLALGFACGGLLLQRLGEVPLPVRSQLAMWLVVPVWLGVAGTVYLFRHVWSALLCLGGVNALAWLWLGWLSRGGLS
ncbi:hypothetical protein THUN1379_12860 [Paludibacterium sp. THUN1379]|uniref:hypothetical protein n=1 Tax=Paludibacterium sp. THUN1379 TaxID=3112107 RepID=UPI0030882968|nr:hypothetical protein THUN1379_12860 [Paludibacterium sp. THUN1379]